MGQHSAHTLPALHTPGLASAPPATLAVAAGVADVRRAPDATSEQVTQALLHTPAAPLEEDRGWVRVRLSDYEGWIEAGNLAEPAASSAHVAVVRAPCATLYRDVTSGDGAGVAYATSVLPVLDSDREPRLHVAMPGGGSAWIARDDVAVREATTPFPEAGPEVAIALARQLLGTPYLWGGVTSAGVDCSGLVQLCCRAAGRIVLRDGDQQYEGIPYVVERGALQAGDLIFFAHDGAITHVALMIGTQSYIHAKGSPESRVMINSLDPASEAFSQRLAHLYAGARRPFTNTCGTHDADA